MGMCGMTDWRLSRLWDTPQGSSRLCLPNSWRWNRVWNSSRILPNSMSKSSHTSVNPPYNLVLMSCMHVHQAMSSDLFYLWLHHSDNLANRKSLRKFYIDIWLVKLSSMIKYDMKMKRMDPFFCLWRRVGQGDNNLSLDAAVWRILTSYCPLKCKVWGVDDYK